MSKDILKVKIHNIKAKMNNTYLSYTKRIVLCTLGFILLLGLTLLFLSKTLDVEEEQIIRYQENGSLDYKVYLKENEFYETPYLEKDMFYIASLIKNINIDIDYQFVIEEAVNMDFSYDIIGKLTIAGDSGKNKLYEKEYILKSNVQETVSDKNIHNIKDNLIIDYDYYNSLANSFKSTYGLDADSELIIYVRVTKSINNESNSVDLAESSNMSLTIPLSQKTLDISINDTGINNSKSIVNESRVTFGNIIFGIISLIIFISSVAVLLRLLELLVALFPSKSKYDKYIRKILKEYDRLIVETPTELKLQNKEIIKIKRFEELLDARDNLKRPIMYHNLVSHQKCYFYIEKDNTVYLLTIKATDLEG